VDALGKIPAGILGGNNLWIGSWSACRRISVIKNRQGQRWNGQYCMARFQPFNRDNPLKNIGSSDVSDPTAQCRYSKLLLSFYNGSKIIILYNNIQSYESLLKILQV
uniref:NRF domain-containing protein n=1 Tax=Ascaris lumbricoides TaxID=6252 RepID=A0A0M3HKG5_ASCLU